MAVKAFPLCCLWSLIHPLALLRLLCFSGSRVSVGYFLFFLLKSYLMCLCIFSLCLFLFNTAPSSFAAHSHVSFRSFLSSNFLSFHHLFASISYEWFFYISCCSLFYCWYIFSPSLSVPCCHYTGSGVSKSFYYLPLAFYGLLSPLQSLTHQSSASS